MRVVIDTNVWISGLLWKGAPWIKAGARSAMLAPAFGWAAGV
jgi:predicted nucleic acid-binding protein